MSFFLLYLYKFCNYFGLSPVILRKERTQMSKRWGLRLLLAVMLLAAFSAAASADEGDDWYDASQEEYFWQDQQEVVFPDVTPEHWSYDDVMYLYRNGIIGGFPDGTFRPEEKVTTGQALKMIILAAGYAEPETVSSHWARGYLNFALEAGILERGEITDLDVSMSRLLTAKVSARALGVTRQDAQQKFSDTNDDSVQALSEIGIIGGYPDGTFRPNGSLTRAELSAIVSRIYAYRLDRNGGSTDNPDDPEDLDSDEPIELRTTDAGIEFIKAREGFTAKAYWDYQQYSIGYGSYCEKDEYPDGITEKQADRLLRKRLQGFEAKLDEFLDKNSIRLKEQEYDALVSFTYNNGDYWMREKNQSRLAALLISGRYSVNEFASAFGIWCHVTSSSGTEIHNGLIERRLKELKLFFYGDYDGRNPTGFSYVIFRTEKGSLDVDVAVYETGSYYDPMFEASCDDDEFFGWVTENGVVIDENTRVEENLTLTALWRSEAEGWF